MSDTVHVINCVDPVKAFEVLAKIIGDKEEMEITLKSLKKGVKKTRKKPVDTS
ncbi:hypothetical protein [Lacrimispora algidixylanolytica]|uniref:hypothetical protein n=1 Tax=Lacrimispora algidixylanolytica TaxID=94868 RepID=UPI00131441D1|nr:hypothetical protein [Lacrimispora algidixylanolytica]